MSLASSGSGKPGTMSWGQADRGGQAAALIFYEVTPGPHWPDKQLKLFHPQGWECHIQAEW